MTERHRHLRAELAQARHDLAAYEVRLSELVQNNAAGSKLAHEMPYVAQRLEAELQAASARVAALEHELHIVRSSTSWRITGPLRRIARAASGAVERPKIASPGPGPESSAPVPEPSLWQGEGLPRALFVSGEDHTPGHIYRVERAAVAARRAGYDARTLSAEAVGPQDLSGVSVVVLWRVPYSAHIQGIITVTREQGGLVIFDVDDLMFRPELAVVPVIDGIRSQNFSEFETQALFRRVAQTLQACDAVSCPTEELAYEARRLGRPAYVIPNGFDAGSHMAARAARRDWRRNEDDLLRIGYAGGSRTHQRDFAVALPAIIRILGEMPQVRLTLFRDPSSGEGVVLVNEFPELAPFLDRIEWRDMVKLEQLPYEMARFTVNIAPLQPKNVFCEAKSELKFFEAALAVVPTIASPTGPFARAIEHGTTGFLATTDEDWYTSLSLLLRYPALRARMAQAAYHVSLAQFGEAARSEKFALMMAQLGGGDLGAAAFERERYRAALPRVAPPYVPDHEILLAIDRQGESEVTVIVPVYDYADYVPEALASVVAQTLEKLDLVVIDDGSPDDSTAMVMDWARLNAGRFNRLTVLRHVKNAGLGFARNSGFAMAETEYVLPLDADNRLRPRACETLLANLSRSHAAFAYPAIQQFGDKKEVIGRVPYSVLRLQLGNYIDAMALVRKSDWALAGGYDHVRFGWEDFDFWCRLAERGRFGISVPEILADYRVHDKSMLHTSTDVRENRVRLAGDLASRHGWLDVV